MANIDGGKKKIKLYFQDLYTEMQLFEIIRNSEIILNADPTNFINIHDAFTSAAIKYFETFPEKITGRDAKIENYFITIQNYLTASKKYNAKISSINKTERKGAILDIIINLISTIYVYAIAHLLKIYYDNKVNNNQNSDYILMATFFDNLLNEINSKLLKIKRGSDIQTFFLMLVFVFGITSVAELTSRVSLKKVLGGKM
jgi:hypothetical protein